MFFREEGNKRKDWTKIRNFLILMGIFLISFILTKAKVVSTDIGVIFIMLLYILINFNMTNMYFSSKRSTFKIYIFIILDIVFFLLGTFNIVYIFFFFLFLFILSYLVIKDEGRMERSKVYNFIFFYVMLRIMFTVILVLL